LRWQPVPRFPSIPTFIGFLIGLAIAKKKTNPLEVEKKLEKSFPKEEWMFLHHALIAFGRKQCHAKNPECALPD
jgi:endonuclease-3